jgi:putative transcriptional regulator
VNAIETGKSDPCLSLAFRIARLFGRPIEEIFLYDAEAGAGPGPPSLRPLAHDRRFE